MTDIHDGREDRLHFGEEFGVHGLGQPVGPLADVVAVGGSRHGGGDIFVGAGELERELSDVGPALVADTVGTVLDCVSVTVMVTVAGALCSEPSSAMKSRLSLPVKPGFGV